MFDGIHSVNIVEINQAQGSVFKHYLGFFDNRKFKSPFRKDSNGGCRFQYYPDTDKWYLVDNAGYKNKLFFTCVEYVQYKFDLSYLEALRKILNEVELEVLDNLKKDSIKALKWLRYNCEENYFNKLGIPDTYLISQGVIPISIFKIEYNNGTNVMKYGDFFSIYDNEVYLPNKIPKFLKIKTRNFYGKLDTTKPIILTEGLPDKLILDYHYNKDNYFCIIAAHNAIKTLPKMLELVSSLYIWFDPDRAGLSSSTLLAKKHSNVTNITNKDFELDIKDLHTLNPNLIIKTLNKIKI